MLDPEAGRWGSLPQHTLQPHILGQPRLMWKPALPQCFSLSIPTLMNKEDTSFPPSKSENHQLRTLLREAQLGNRGPEERECKELLLGWGQDVRKYAFHTNAGTLEGVDFQWV